MTTGPEEAPEAVDGTSADATEETADATDEADARGTRDEADTPEAAHEEAPGTGAVRIPPQPGGVASASAGNGAGPGTGTGTPGSTVGDDGDADVTGPLMTGAEELRSSWQHILAGFVDDPRGSVASAATMVEETTQTLVAALRERERRLRGAWEGNGTTPDTEDLRIALRKYRTFFEKIAGL